MKSIWVDGDVKLHRPLRSRMKMLWTLAATTITLLCLWVIGLATGYLMGGWIHVLLAVAILLTLPWIFYGFKYGDFLEPVLFRWKRESTLRHTSPNPALPGQGGHTEARRKESDPEAQRKFGSGPGI